jgi:hypothetical protein
MTRHFLISLAAAAAAAGLWPCFLAAQSPDAPNEGVQVGDRWVFDRTDEMTGYPKDTYTRIVTEVSDKEIVTNVFFRGNPTKTVMIFDRDWALVDNSSAKWKPNDGEGVRLPLAIGKSWRSEYDEKTNAGANLRGSVVNKVTAQETLTTTAGTFETFKIETTVKIFSPADPSKLWEIQKVKWYAPQINFWVRDTFLSKFDKRVRESTRTELVDFSRKF